MWKIEILKMETLRGLAPDEQAVADRVLQEVRERLVPEIQHVITLYVQQEREACARLMETIARMYDDRPCCAASYTDGAAIIRERANVPQ